MLWSLACLSAVYSMVPAAAFAEVPDPNLTPGAIDPEVTQADIHATICRAGWSRVHRPPDEVTEAIKRRQVAERDPDQPLSAFEEDHLIPISLGGALADPANLWPQPREAPDGRTAARKDHLETVLHALVCSGRIPLATAQHAIASNWTAAYLRYGDAVAVSAARAPEPRSSGRAAGPGGRCPGDAVVWLNTRTGVFHEPGSRWYGATREGRLMCARAAVAEGGREAANGQ